MLWWANQHLKDISKIHKGSTHSTSTSSVEDLQLLKFVQGCRWKMVPGWWLGWIWIWMQQQFTLKKKGRGCYTLYQVVLLQQTPSVTPTADPAWPPVKAFHLQTACLIFHIWLLPFIFPSYCHCHSSVTCISDLWEALFRKCLLNSGKLISGNNYNVCPSNMIVACLFS